MLALKILGAAMLSVGIVSCIILIALVAIKIFDIWEENKEGE